MLPTIKEQLKDAMFKKNKKRISALRNILAKVKMKEIEKNNELTNEEFQKVLQAMAKQLKDSIEQYLKGGRTDLADNESEELEILNEFLPEPMSEHEVNNIVINVINEIKASKNVKDKANFFAKRFAAKEAFVKSLGSGFRNGINFNDISVKNNNLGKPQIHLNRNIRSLLINKFKLRKFKIFLSLADESKHSIAFVIINKI